MKSPDLRPFLDDFNVFNFSGEPDQEVKRSVTSLFVGLAIDYGIAAASGALIMALAPHHPDLAHVIQETSTILIMATSATAGVFTFFHYTFAGR